MFTVKTRKSFLEMNISVRSRKKNPVRFFNFPYFLKILLFVKFNVCNNDFFKKEIEFAERSAIISDLLV